MRQFSKIQTFDKEQVFKGHPYVPTPTWFNTPERIALLEFKAVKWIGTPFLANSDELGRGVSCQKLASRIYAEAGFASIDVPEVKMQHSKFGAPSLVEPFMDARAEFASVRNGSASVGDLLGFTIGKVVHHVGIVVSAEGFIHVCRGLSVRISPFTDPTWFSRLRRIWRPRP